MKKLRESDCLACMASGEFPAEVVGAAAAVAVVLTQSWCHQWRHMRSYLESMGDAGGAMVFWVEYDLESFFEPFMAFKEEAFGNREVPYVRYYRGGALSAESNYVDRERFLALLGPSPRP